MVGLVLTGLIAFLFVTIPMVWLYYTKGTINNKETIDLPQVIRKLNLACGDGYKHPDTCNTLRSLRELGYSIKQEGNFLRSNDFILRIRKE